MAKNTLPLSMVHAFGSLLLKHHLPKDSLPNHSEPSPHTQSSLLPPFSEASITC